MTDRRRKHLANRVWRSTLGRLCPLHRTLAARRFWAWWTARGVIPRWQLLLVYALVVGVSMVGLASTRSIADENRVLALRVDGLARAIQDQRKESIRTNCRTQNKRHKAAISATLRLLARPAVPPSRTLTPAQQRAQRTVIVGWVGVLVPKQNCALLVKKATGIP